MTTLHIRKKSEIPLFEREFEADPNWIKTKNSATGSYKDKILRYDLEHRDHLSRIKQSKTIQPTATQRQVVQLEQTSKKQKKSHLFLEWLCVLSVCCLQL